MEEIWKPVKGFEDYYQVSSHGKIRSLHKNSFGLILRQCKTDKGYLRIELNVNGKAKTFFVHDLMGIAFIPNPENKPTINHIDGIKNHNMISNLEWATHSEQNYHAYRTGLLVHKHNTGSFGKFLGDHWGAKPVVQSTKTGEFVKEYTCAREAVLSGFNYKSISRCCNGDKKSHGGFIWKFKPILNE